MKIIPYKLGSVSAKTLAAALGTVCIRQEGKPLRKLDTLINWGCSQINRDVGDAAIINHPDHVKNASNKLCTLEILKEAGVLHVPFTNDPIEASKWILDGYSVCGRFKLNGHSGDGLVIFENEEQFDKPIPVAPLYTKYIPKKEEYRVHVAFGKVIHVQRKARKLEIPDNKVNWKVRNLKGGFIYANDGVDVPDKCKLDCITSVVALGLDFGAVDVIYNEKQNKYYILEVNTAPGLSGKTIDKYVEVFNGPAAT